MFLVQIVQGMQAPICIFGDKNVVFKYLNQTEKHLSRCTLSLLKEIKPNLLSSTSYSNIYRLSLKKKKLKKPTKL